MNGQGKRNVDLKQIWQLPHETHRYFFEHLTECRHLKILLIKRFLKFVGSTMHGDKSYCRLLLRTIIGSSNSTTGRNMRKIELEAGMNIGQYEDIKDIIEDACKRIKFQQVPEDQIWRISLAKELSIIKSRNSILEGFSPAEVDEMLQYVCVS